jgi:hypothetical protein
MKEKTKQATNVAQLEKERARKNKLTGLFSLLPLIEQRFVQSFSRHS